MEELNNWDSETIEEILDVARLYRYQAENLAKDHLAESSNEAIGKTARWTELKEASRHFGQAQAYSLIISKGEQMLADNAEAIEATQEICEHHNYSTTMNDCDNHKYIHAECYTHNCDNCNAELKHAKIYHQEA